MKFFLDRLPFLKPYMHFEALNGFKFRLALRATKTVHENGLKNQHEVPQCIGMCCATNGMEFQRSKRQ